MHCRFNQLEKREVEVKLGGIVVQKCTLLRYLGSLFQENGMIDDDVTHRIKTR